MNYLVALLAALLGIHSSPALLLPCCSFGDKSVVRSNAAALLLPYRERPDQEVSAGLREEGENKPLAPSSPLRPSGFAVAGRGERVLTQSAPHSSASSPLSSHSQPLPTGLVPDLNRRRPAPPSSVEELINRPTFHTAQVVQFLNTTTVRPHRPSKPLFGEHKTLVHVHRRPVVAPGASSPDEDEESLDAHASGTVFGEDDAGADFRNFTLTKFPFVRRRAAARH